LTQPPLVSIVLATFNRLKYLRPSLESVFAQTFQDWELIIADDGSDSETVSYLASVAGLPRVKVLRLTHTGRPAVVRNAALRQVRGEYVAFMDSDDLWLPDKLEIQLASLSRRRACRWSQTTFVLVDACGDSIKQMPAADGWILEKLLNTETAIALPSVVAHRKLIEQVGGFDEELVTGEDFDLWLRLAAQSEVDAVDQPLTLVRRHSEHYANATTAIRNVIRVLDKVLRSESAGQLHPIVRKKRATLSALLARSYVSAGDRVGALGAVLSAAPRSWRYQEWWSGALQATASALAPEAMRRVARKYRSARPIGG
jgi:glycosyltransferase involved in cell wall biosynthesis